MVGALNNTDGASFAGTSGFTPSTPLKAISGAKSPETEPLNATQTGPKPPTLGGQANLGKPNAPNPGGPAKPNLGGANLPPKAGLGKPPNTPQGQFKPPTPGTNPFAQPL